MKTVLQPMWMRPSDYSLQRSSVCRICVRAKAQNRRNPSKYGGLAMIDLTISMELSSFMNNLSHWRF